jgi:hypothetical protein
MEKVHLPEQEKEIIGESGKDRQSVLDSLTKAAGRSRVFRALLLSTSLTSLEGCAGKFGIGATGPLEHVEAEDHPSIKGEKLPSYEKMLEEMRLAVGETYVQNALEVQQRYAQANEKREKGKTLFLGFENLDITPGEVRRLFTETMPHSWWGNGHVGEIKINPHFVAMRYPGLNRKPEYAHCQPFTNGKPIEIEFNHESLGETEELQSKDVHEVFSSMLHELAHASDWGTASSLQPEQALTLMYLAHQSIKDPGRPRFSYPEKIHHADAKNKQKETAQKMTEFFAVLMETALLRQDSASWHDWEHSLATELVSQHAASPEGARRAVRLVRTHLAWTAPGFLPWEAAAERYKLIQNIRQHHEFRRFEKLLLTHLQDHETGRRLAQALTNTAVMEKDAVLQMYLLTNQDVTQDKQLQKDIKPLPDVKFSGLTVAMAFHSANSLLEAALRIRANEIEAPGAPFFVNISEDAIARYNDEYRRLSHGEREELRRLIFRRLEILEGKYPPGH